MAYLDFATQASPGTPSSGFVRGYPDSTTKRWTSIDDGGSITPYQYQVTNASVAAASGAFASDTYLSGSALTIPTAGAWTAGMTAAWIFDMVKTGAGTAAFTVNIRMGTAGTTGDASILSLAFAVGTAAIDTGMFRVWANFRTVGSGTSAVVAGIIECQHHLAATGLITTGASGTGIITGTSAGFNSTTQTIIGLSVNGGGSFSGTNTIVQSILMK